MRASSNRLMYNLAALTILALTGLGMAETKHVAEGEGLKSVHSDVEALVTFHNVSGQTVKVYWLDFAGNRVLYMTLQNDAKVGQATYLTHPWLVTDENDNALAIYYADAQPRTVEITARVAQ